MAAPGGSAEKSPPQCRRCRRLGSIPDQGRSPGGGHGNPLQYSCLENTMDRGAWRAQPIGLQRGFGHNWSDWVCMHPPVSNVFSNCTYTFKHTAGCRKQFLWSMLLKAVPRFQKSLLRSLVLGTSADSRFFAPDSLDASLDPNLVWILGKIPENILRHLTHSHLEKEAV